jgi:hypothetical protein
MYGWLPENCDDASQVVTASRRLARLLTAEYNAQQLAAGSRHGSMHIRVASFGKASCAK